MKRTFLAAVVLLTGSVLTGGAMTGTATAADGSSSNAPTVTPAQKIYPYIQPSIVFIKQTWSAEIFDNYQDNGYVRDQPFTLTSACTGFVVSPDGYIATAGHCLNPQDDKYGIDLRFDIMDQGVAWALKTGAYGDISKSDLQDHALKHWQLVSPSSSVGDRIKQPVLHAVVSWGANVSGLKASDGLPARVMGRSTFNNGDVGLLKVDAENLNALNLAEGKAETGENLLAIGYPGKVDAVVDDDYTPSVKPGTVSSYKTVGDGTTPVYEISAAVAPGMSGGPTVNLKGEVLGVNSFGTGDSEAFNFVRPVSLIKEMMGSVEPSQSSQTKQYIKGLDAYFAGDKKAALSNLKAVAEDQPANGIVKTYIDKAEQLKDPPPPPKDETNWALIGGIVGGILLLLLLAGGLWALMRGRGKRSATPPPAPGLGASAPIPGGPSQSAYTDAPLSDLGEPAGPLVSSGSAPGGAPNGTPAGPPVGSSAGPYAGPPAGAPQMEAGPTGQVGFAAPGGAAGTTSTTRALPAQAQAPTAESVAPALEHQFCTSCGTKLEPGMKFCGECGTRA